jgi:hypothetical protein
LLVGNPHRQQEEDHQRDAQQAEAGVSEAPRRFAQTFLPHRRLHRRGFAGCNQRAGHWKQYIPRGVKHEKGVATDTKPSFQHWHPAFYSEKLM